MNNLIGAYPDHFTARRTVTDAFIVHHTVTMADWISIANYHINVNGWSGIGYHLGVDPDGTVNLLAYPDTIRAHVKDQNHRYVGVALRGDFTNAPPPLAQLRGLAKALSWLWGLYGDKPIKGHREVALASDPTACPGNTYPWQGGAMPEPTTDLDRARIALDIVWGRLNALSSIASRLEKLEHGADGQEVRVIGDDIRSTVPTIKTALGLQ